MPATYPQAFINPAPTLGQRELNSHCWSVNFLFPFFLFLRTTPSEWCLAVTPCFAHSNHSWQAWGTLRCRGLNLGWPHKRQMPSLLCYCSGPSISSFLSRQAGVWGLQCPHVTQSLPKTTLVLLPNFPTKAGISSSPPPPPRYWFSRSASSEQFSLYPSLWSQFWGTVTPQTPRYWRKAGSFSISFLPL